ncbi:P-loop containing nucleoside triphosphate hydrolase protein [Trametes coccinea BRFM310]|uniref:DNA 3'-5' helicase n=1 Tax=Trametes coccinea (strain BRFM310) TaxID=1353009 RepID=A0A1Y2J210_TRAC3|nr:P-loop containing nucleoside triphosphate hydrolase protein [Trametes coccinea BRFM310]
MRRSARRRLTKEEMTELATLMRKRFGWSGDPRYFQLEGVRAQLEGDDMIIQASTGAGKTAIAAGPHLWPASRGRITIMVCPLLVLEHEMVETFKMEFGLRAVAINSATGRCTNSMVQELLAGMYQIILISPEMLQSASFVNRVLRKPAFAKRVLSVVVDEAHCVSHWGASFRKKYASLGVIRAFLPRGTPVIAMTATLTARVRRDLHCVLHFPKHGSRFINIGNDRPNVTIVVRACQHAQNTYADLEFIIPADVRSAADIPKTYVYVDNIAVGNEIIDYLVRLLARRCPSLATHPLIRPYNATLSHEYRAEAMEAFRTNPPSQIPDEVTPEPGAIESRNDCIRILVCTDAAGMGCNVPDVDLVIQWKLPKTLSHFVQRAGRAARSPARQGLAVLLVERSAYSIDLTRSNSNLPGASENRAAKQVGKSTTKKARVVQSAKGSKLPKDYAVNHGLNRGSTARDDSVPTAGDEPVLDVEADDEGLLVFVQTRLCRRKIWTEIFESPISQLHPGIACCDLCNPTILDRTRPGTITLPSKPRMRVRGVPDFQAQMKLCKWRQQVFRRDHALSQLDTSAILDQSTLTTLTSLGPLTADHLVALLKGSWIWWDRYGEELTALIITLDIIYRPIKKSQVSGSKRPSNEASAAVSSEDVSSQKRQRLDSTGMDSSAPSASRTPSAAGLAVSMASSPSTSHGYAPATPHTPGPPGRVQPHYLHYPPYPYWPGYWHAGYPGAAPQTPGPLPSSPLFIHPSPMRYVPSPLSNPQPPQQPPYVNIVLMIPYTASIH